MKSVITLNAAALGAPAGHYSHAATAESSAKLFFISGQLPITPEGRKLTGESFQSQVKQVFANLDEVLSACQCERNDLIKVTVYIKDIRLWPEFNSLYAQWLGSHQPARSVVPVPELHYGLDLEVEAIACK